MDVSAIMQVRRTREDWARLFSEFEAGGETVSRFCARREISVATFGWWRSKLRCEARSAGAPVGARARRAPTAAGVALLPVRVVGEDPARAENPIAITLTFAGIEMRVAAGTDASYVTALVTQLLVRC